MTHPIQSLTDLFAELPGIGPRQARRIVQFILRSDKRFPQKLSEAMRELATHVKQCSSCFRFDDIHQGVLCSLCANSTRDTETLLVVEKDVDIEGIESSGAYKGYYFVLGALMPLRSNRKTASAPRLEALLKRLHDDQKVKEVILAFATTPEGDFTAKEIKNVLNEKQPALRVSLPARGLSLGAEIEYADQETLRSALSGRH
ncbi:MAG: toprim domain-containing protein [Patescibacteria group bacterium]